MRLHVLHIENLESLARGLASKPVRRSRPHTFKTVRQEGRQPKQSSRCFGPWAKGLASKSGCGRLQAPRLQNGAPTGPGPAARLGVRLPANKGARPFGGWVYRVRRRAPPQVHSLPIRIAHALQRDFSHLLCSCEASLHSFPNQAKARSGHSVTSLRKAAATDGGVCTRDQTMW